MLNGELATCLNYRDNLGHFRVPIMLAKNCHTFLENQIKIVCLMNQKVTALISDFSSLILPTSFQNTTDGPYLWAECKPKAFSFSQDYGLTFFIKEYFSYHLYFGSKFKLKACPVLVGGPCTLHQQFTLIRLRKVLWFDLHMWRYKKSVHVHPVSTCPICPTCSFYAHPIFNLTKI